MYHVINRGNYRSWIFNDDGGKAAFEKCLFEACEGFGWILHGYCIMGNHFHLALETPNGNLSKGMGWLQSTFAMRFNSYRKEHGSLFQGRFKSIVVEDWEGLGWLCHYIHLNPVRAGIVSVDNLESYERSSYAWLLRGKKGRPQCLSFGAMLDVCGHLKDGPVGRRKYGEYLAWLVEDEPRQKEMRFDRMSRGWALGSKDFKVALLEDGKKEVARRVLDGDAGDEARELLWERMLENCLSLLGRSALDIQRDAKSAEWKIGVCAYLRQEGGCRMGWICEKLRMGVAAGASRCMKRLRTGEAKEAAKVLKLLKSKIKS